MNKKELKIADEKIIAFTQIKRLNNVVDKLEQRIATLEKVIGKLQLRLGDVVLYIDKIEKEKQCPIPKQ